MKTIENILLALMLVIVVVTIYFTIYKVEDYIKNRSGTITMTSVKEVRQFHKDCTGTTTTNTIYNRPPGNPRKPIAWTVKCTK